eukprot:m.65282 g.65282  ORF g.65282 m.65282 type:complete len:278 (+) comp49785_c0_seq1:1-834(+)
MSFAFNFESDEVVGGVASRLDAEPPPAHVLPIPWHAIATSGFASALYTFPTAAPILTINQTQAEMLLSQHGGAVAQASAMSSDLVPQMYEGGMKVWECCSDLIEFLQTSQLLRPHHTVLEVGCGAGLPGVFAARLGCTVHFQDFNDEVLVQVTAPTLFLNVKEMDILARSQFISGDWRAVQLLLESQSCSYNVILASETLYALENLTKFYLLLKSRLSYPDGVAIIATKTYYFGVGGGTLPFQEIVQQDGCMNLQVLSEVTEGVRRQVLLLSFLPPA